MYLFKRQNRLVSHTSGGFTYVSVRASACTNARLVSTTMGCCRAEASSWHARSLGHSGRCSFQQHILQACLEHCMGMAQLHLGSDLRSTLFGVTFSDFEGVLASLRFKTSSSDRDVHESSVCLVSGCHIQWSSLRCKTPSAGRDVYEPHVASGFLKRRPSSPVGAFWPLRQYMDPSRNAHLDMLQDLVSSVLHCFAS